MPWRVVHKFHYLKYALSIVLVLVGAKMLVNGYFGAKTIPTEYALIATAVTVFGSIFVSLLRKDRPEDSKTLPTGWVVGSPAKSTSKPADDARKS